MIDKKRLIEDLKKHFDAVYREDGELLQSDHVCTAEDVDNLIALVNSQPKVGEWIPCSVDAPDDNQIVVVSTIDGGIHIATFHIAKWKNYCWYSFETGGMFTSPYVTAWLPLPEPYKGEK